MNLRRSSSSAVWVSVCLTCFLFGCQSWRQGDAPVVHRHETITPRLELRDAHAQLPSAETGSEPKQTSVKSPAKLSQESALIALREAAGLGNYDVVRGILLQLPVSVDSRPAARLLEFMGAFARGERTGAEGWLDDILRDFESVRSTMPHQEAADFLFAHALVTSLSRLELGKESLGMEALSNAQSLRPEREEPYLILCRYFLKNDRLEAARRVLEEGVAQVASPSPELLIARGQVARALGEERIEAMMLRRARQRNPASRRLDQYETIRDFESRLEIDACASFASLYDVGSAEPDLAFNHAYCLRAQGFHENAENVLQKAVSLFPARNDLRVLLTGVLAERDKVLEADLVWRKQTGGPLAGEVRPRGSLEDGFRSRSSRRLLEVLSGLASRGKQGETGP